MGKTIKSNVRKLLHTMISKFKQKQDKTEVIFKEKQECLRVVSDFLDGLKGVQDVSEIVKTIDTLKNLDRKSLMKTQTEYLEEISSLTEVSLTTLKKIKKEGSVNDGLWSTPGKKRPHKRTVSDLDSFDMDAIRNKINEFYIVRKEVPTLRSLLEELRSSIEFSGSRETLRQILLANGYEFKKNKNERTVLIERYDISAWRHKYLRQIAAKRAEGKPIIYLDETYVHKNYKPKKTWQGPSTSGVAQPSPVENISSGKRYIIVHAGSEAGFVPNALLVFSTKSRLADYHHDMNSQNFNKWLEDKLIPNLSEPSVIVMDNASYHTVKKNKVPTTANRKAEIREWLNANEISYEDYETKAELLCLVNKHKPETLYEADEMLKQYGHEVLRLPPYHCDLNPIELIWSTAKRMVAKKNINLTADETERLISESFERITAADWKTMTDHVINVENKYKLRDRITEEEIDKFIISVGDSSSDSEESLEVEFLDSDFEYND